MSTPKRPSEMVIYNMDGPLQMIQPRPTAEQLVEWNKLVFADEGELLVEEPYIVDVATGARLAGQIPADVSVALVVLRSLRPPD